MAKKSHSKLRKVIPIALGLAVGGAGVAANADDIDYSFWNRTADFMFDVSYINKPINRNEETNLRKLIRGGKDETFYAISPVEAFRGRIAYLESEEGKKKFPNPALRSLYIERFQDFINYCEKNNLKPSKKSLEKLSAGAKDGILEPSEFDGVEDNLYVIVGRGGDPYRVFLLAPVVSETTPAQYQTEINDLNNQIRDLNAQVNQLSQTPAQPQPQEQSQSQFQTQTQSQPQSQTPPQEQKQETARPQKKESNLELYFSAFGGPGILGITTDNDGNTILTNALPAYGGFVGGRVGITGKLNDGFWLGGSLKGAYGFPETVGSINTQSNPTSTGRYFIGSKTNSGALEIGLGSEALFGKGPVKVIVGGDVNVWIYNQESSTGWYKNGNSVEPPNSGSSVKYDFSAEVHSGVKIDYLRLIGNWDSRKGIYAEAGVSIPINTENIQN